MPETKKTTVTQDDNGYYRVRVPKALGDAMGFDGGDVKVEWSIESGKKLSMEKVNE